MDEDEATYEFRHIFVARYGHFRIDRVWSRTSATDAHEHPSYYVVFEIDASSEFDVLAGFSRATQAKAVPTRSELYRELNLGLLPIDRRQLESREPSQACYRRRVGPPDGEHEASPGEWHVEDFSASGGPMRRPGKPLITLRETVSLVEAALHELEETDTDTAG